MIVLWSRATTKWKEDMMTTKKVLLLLDGSLFSQQIMPHIQQFIQPTEADIVLLRVAEWPHGYMKRPARITAANWQLPLDLAHYDYDMLGDADWPGHPIYASQEAERIQALLGDELEAQATQLRDAGYRTTVAVAFGNPAEEIIQFVEREGIDLVAMATHGRTGIEQLVLSSVAERVLHAVTVPVLLVRPVAHPKQATTSTAGQHHTCSV